MSTLRRRSTLCALVCVMVAGFAVAGLSKGPQDCGVNVATIVTVDYTGPLALTRAAHGGYDLTITVEKEKPSEPASVCYVVYEQDPWFKTYWGRDDVLAEGRISLPAGQDTWTIPAAFSLINVDGRACGMRWAPTFVSSDGERVAEVFVEIVTASGSATSPVKLVRAQ